MNLSRKNRKFRILIQSPSHKDIIIKTASFTADNKRMGSIFSNFLASFSNMKAKILMLGLDGAGKTTILYQFKLNDTVHSVPTIGFNV